MDFKDLIVERRSVRSYAEKAVENVVIDEILKDAQMAPTWKNSQTGRYYVVNTPEMLEKVRACLPGFNQNSSKNAALIVTSFVKNVAGFTAGQADNELGNEWGAYDLGLQNAYLVLAARERGLDTLIMGLRDADGLREVLGIPVEEEIAAVLALGYREKEPVFKSRKALEDIRKVF